MAARAVTRLTAAGWAGCGYFRKARTALQGLSVLAPDDVAVEIIEHPDRDAFVAWWTTFKPSLGKRAEAHTSSPAVWLNGTDFLGGCDAPLAWIQRPCCTASSPCAKKTPTDVSVTATGTSALPPS